MNSLMIFFGHLTIFLQKGLQHRLRLRRRAVGRCRRGAIGRRRHTVFASPGPPPSPLGVAVPCTRLAVPLCHPAASICVVTPLCAAVVVVRGARALRGWRLFSGAVPGPWACRWGGGEGAAGAADAVDLFEEIWSDVQKISLKNSWTL